MSDRELLELAARAAGMRVLVDKNWPREPSKNEWFYNDAGGTGCLYSRIGTGQWNPHALREVIRKAIAASAPSPTPIAKSFNLDAITPEEPADIKGRFQSELFWRGAFSMRDAVKAALSTDSGRAG